MASNVDTITVYAGRTRSRSNSCVDTVTASVEGIPGADLSVQALDLDLAVNAIPSVTLEILPVESKGGMGSKFTSVSTAKIQEVTDLYSRLSDMASTLQTKATIKAEVKLDCTDHPQKLELKDWILVDVGLSSVTPRAAPVLNVTFQHPIVMLARTGFIYESLESDPDEELKMVEGDDVIEVMDDVYSKGAGDAFEYYEIAPASEEGLDDQYKKKITQFRRKLAEEKPGKYIKSNVSGFFLQEVNDSLTDAMRFVTASMLMPMAFDGMSTWRRLIGTVCSDMQMMIVPTYDKDKLELEPHNPWQTASYMITSQFMTSVDMPPMDRYPLIGVAMDKRVFNGGGNVHGGAARSSNGTRSITQAFYVPEPALDGDMVGDIMPFSDSPYILSILDADIGANQNYHGGGAQQNPQDMTNGVEPEDHAEMTLACAKGVFQSSYRAGCVAALTTIPMFTDYYGKAVYPGRVVNVQDEESGVTLFYGMITTMKVRLSANGGGSTYYGISHARPYSGSQLIPEGTENPCYPPPTRD